MAELLQEDYDLQIREQQVADQAASGDPQVIGQIYALYHDRLCRFIGGKFGADHAEDVVQETYARAMIAIEDRRYENQGQGSLFNWLSRIALNKRRDRYRRDKKILMLPTDFSEHYNNLPSSEDVAATVVSEISVADSLSSLLPRYRDAISAVVIDGASYQAYSDESGVNIGTVRSQIHRAKRDLRTTHEKTQEV